MISLRKNRGPVARNKGTALFKLLLLAAVLPSPALATQPAQGNAVLIGARYERAVNFVGGLEQVAIEADVPFTLHWQPFGSFQAEYFVQVSGGAFLNGSPDARPFVEAGPAIRLESGTGGWFLSAGIAPTLIGGSEFRDSRQLGGSIFFTSHVDVGWQTGSWMVALRYQHTSNANFNNPNPGVNMVGLAFGTTL